MESVVHDGPDGQGAQLLAPSEVSSREFGHRLTLAALGEEPTPANSAELSGRSLSMPWRLSAIHDTAKTIEIYFAEGDGSCVVPQGVHVEQTSTSVTIEAVSNQTASAGEACPSVLKSGWVTVQLTWRWAIVRICTPPLRPGGCFLPINGHDARVRVRMGSRSSREPNGPVASYRRHGLA